MAPEQRGGQARAQMEVRPHLGQRQVKGRPAGAGAPGHLVSRCVFEELKATLDSWGEQCIRKGHGQHERNTPVFTAASLTMDKRQKQPERPPMNERRNTVK